MSIKMPFWLRSVSLVGVVLLLTGVSLLAYRYYERPTTLTVAVGSIDGEGAKAMSAIASRLASTNASVRSRSSMPELSAKPPNSLRRVKWISL